METKIKGWIVKRSGQRVTMRNGVTQANARCRSVPHAKHLERTAITARPQHEDFQVWVRQCVEAAAAAFRAADKRARGGRIVSYGGR